MSWSENELKYLEKEPLFDTTAHGRSVSYAEAIREGFSLALERYPEVFIMGQGIDDPSGMFGTTIGLHNTFGVDRIFDTPLAEASLTGIAMGAALGGMRPIYLHNRCDFLLLITDQLINHASKWHFMFGGSVSVPMVLWACIGQGWGSAAQHSQALQGLFMHVPGLKLVMPSTCFDAKGLLLAAVEDNNPVLIIDHRSNFKQTGNVPNEIYTVPLGEGTLRKEGRDVSVIAISYMANEVTAIANEFVDEGIDVEVIDPRTLRPLDEDLILNSVKKTGRLVVVDPGWKTCGASAEIAALVVEKAFSSLRSQVIRVTCPDVPTPAGFTLEKSFYINRNNIKKAIRKIVSKK